MIYTNSTVVDTTVTPKKVHTSNIIHTVILCILMYMMIPCLLKQTTKKKKTSAEVLTLLKKQLIY